MMTFEQYWTIMVKQWRLIVICFLLVGVGAAVGTRLMTPLYQSTVLVQVADSTESVYYGLLAGNELVQTEATLATGDSVLREVASHYKGLTVAQLSKEVTAAAMLNTQLFEINVLDPSSTRSAALANDIAATLVKQQLQLTQQGAARFDLLVVQTAHPSPSPAQPDIRLNTGAGLLVGLLLGIVLAVLFERLDTRVRTPEGLVPLLDWPVLATIWQASLKEEVVNPTGHNANVESYRILRTNIGFSAIDKPLHTLVVTSPLPGDGKSVVAVNLAISMAKAGKTTLLIDADLRNPVLYELFGLSKDKMGLSNAVLEFNKLSTRSIQQLHPAALQAADALTPANLSLAPFIHAVDIPNLWVMPSGPLPPNPPELLDSKAMQRLLPVIANCGAEVVIFDTSPLLGLSDVSILAPKVDGILLVVDITRANKKHLKQAKTQLTQAGAHVLGCVVNKQRRSRQDAAYSYYLYHTGEQNGERINHGAEDTNIPTTPVHIPKYPET